MKVSSLFLSAVSVALAASMITACSSNGSSAAFAPPASAAANGHRSVSPSAANLLAMTTAAKVTPSRRTELPKTRMMPNHCTPWPLCVYFELVDICSFCPGPQLDTSIYEANEVAEYAGTLNTLTGFNGPYGECVDAKGNTWITNFTGGSVVEYARGGTQPIGALSTDGYSIGCSVSPNGDLAVSNFTASNGIGNIQIFKHAAGTPAEYANEQFLYLWPPGYDNKGNLFVEAESYYSNGVVVAELPAGGSGLEPVSVNQTIYFPGSVMWDGKYITLSDQNAGDNPSNPETTIYQMSEQGAANLAVVGSTPLQDSCNGNQVDVVQPFIAGRNNTPVNAQQGEVVIGGNLSCQNRVDAWKYPAGGQPIAVANPVPTYVYGQAVSVRKK